MTETVEAKSTPSAGSGMTPHKGARLAPAIQPKPADDPSPHALQHQGGAKLDVQRDNRHSDLAGQITQCRATGTQVLRAQSFAERAQLLRRLHAALVALVAKREAAEHEPKSALSNAILIDQGFLQGLDRMGKLATLAARTLPDQKMIVCSPTRPCARGGSGEASAPSPNRQVRMRLKQPGSGLAAHVVANTASFPNLLERISLAILAGRSVLICASDTAQAAAHGLSHLLRSTNVLPEKAVHVVPVIDAATLLPHLERGDVVTLCAAPNHTATFHAHPKVLDGSIRLGACQADYAALLMTPEYDPGPSEWELFLQSVQTLHNNASFATCILVPQSLEKCATDQLLTVFENVTLGNLEEPISQPSSAKASQSVRAQVTLFSFGDTDVALDILRRFPGRRNVTVLSRQHEFLGDFLATLAPCLNQIDVVSPETDANTLDTDAQASGTGSAAENILSLLDFYLEESEISGPATLLSEVSGTWIEGVPVCEGEHPFRKPLSRLRIGDHMRSVDRIVRAEDVEAFGHLTGDLFYAHMDETAACGHPFFDGRVAHGQFVMALANGLFVDPEPGPVLANLGGRDLHFFAPVYFDTTLYVTLTCCAIGPIGKGGSAEVQWACQVLRSDDDTRVAQFDLLTLVAAQWPMPTASVPDALPPTFSPEKNPA
ncbi:MAG: MaoC/PaaZ C-terminal domain-containing protein [Paracoccaceae bacterium]|uniref:MaoC/PaaZ C-terminal domain-containing protein n=1 Tax=Pseudomonadota TaxID=1224 RepID=UPI003299C6B5